MKQDRTWVFIWKPRCQQVLNRIASGCKSVGLRPVFSTFWNMIASVCTSVRLIYGRSCNWRKRTSVDNGCWYWWYWDRILSRSVINSNSLTYSLPMVKSNFRHRSGNVESKLEHHYFLWILALVRILFTLSIIIQFISIPPFVQKLV